MSPALLNLLGGSALLIYSMQELSKSAQYVAGARFRIWINTFGRRRVWGILVGMVLAVLLSGSGAVTAMLVGMSNSRLMSLEQIFSVTLGASVGSTFIVHLFAFRLSHYGLLITFIGVTLESLSRSDRLSRVARSMTYLGLMFFSLALLDTAGKALENDELFRYTLNYFRDRPLVSLFISAALTALVHSSAATLGFVMTLMASRGASIEEAMPWILGANLGTTATGFMASLGDGELGKQAALGHLLCKLFGVIVCFPFLGYLSGAAAHWAPSVEGQIAVVHTLFNAGIAVLFFPFIPWGVRLVRAAIPEKKNEGPFRFLYLDDRTLGTPELALALAQREILRLADTVEKMVEHCLMPFRQRDQKEIELLKGMDQVVDFINKGVKLYLTKLSQNEMTPEQVQKEFELLLRTNDLENIGDTVDKNILELVKKAMKKGYDFSEEGWKDIQSLHGKVLDLLRLSTAYFNSRDRGLYAKMMLLHSDIQDLTIDLSERHVQRLHRGVKASLESSSVHLDILGNLQRISQLAINFTRVQGVRLNDSV